MELDIHYVNFKNSDTECRTLPKIPSQSQDAGKAQKCRRSGCLVLIAIAMCFVLLICGVLLVFVILQHISITADKGQSKTYKDTFQVFNETINRLQNSYSDLMTKKDQLQEKFNVMSDELNKAYHKAENNLSKNYKDTIQVFNETMNRLQDSCSNLRTNKDQLQDKFNIMSDELQKAYQKVFQLSSGWFFMSSVLRNWSESRQYCKDRGADLVIIKTEVKQHFITSLINVDRERVWIGLTDINQEGKMQWVDNSTLEKGFWQATEPNNDRGNEDCVELASSLPPLNNWNDLPCSLTLKAICEK